MNTVTKILIVILILTTLLTACASKPNANKSIVSRVAEKITGYAMPEGYSEELGVDLWGYQLVSFKGSSDNCHLYLVQAPKDTEVDIEKLKEQASEMQGAQKADRTTRVQTVETRTVTVRGQEVPMVVGEGVNSQNQTYREIAVVFEGRGGPALLSISSPVDQWDWNRVDAFIVSLE